MRAGRKENKQDLWLLSHVLSPPRWHWCRKKTPRVKSAPGVGYQCCNGSESLDIEKNDHHSTLLSLDLFIKGYELLVVEKLLHS